MQRCFLWVLFGTLTLSISFPGANAQTANETPSAATWIERGKIELARGSSTEAETDFRQAIALEPDNAQASVLLARALLAELPPNPGLSADSQNLLPKAEQAVQRALALSPGDPDALCVAGIVNYKIAATLQNPREAAQRLNQAHAAFRGALEMNPNSLEAHYELARLLLETATEPVLAGFFQSGMQGGQTGPIENIEIRRRLQARYGFSIEQAMSHLTQDLNLDPRYEPAVRAISGAFMLRSVLQDTDSAYAADRQSYKFWQEKDNAILADQRAAAPPRVTPLPAGIGSIVGAIPSEAPTPRANPPQQKK
jgi:tetratricopeptide (TPR) repeat protein